MIGICNYLVVEAYRLDRYYNVFKGNLVVGCVVEAYRLDRYYNLLVVFLCVFKLWKPIVWIGITTAEVSNGKVVLLWKPIVWIGITTVPTSFFTSSRCGSLSFG